MFKGQICTSLILIQIVHKQKIRNILLFNKITEMFINYKSNIILQTKKINYQIKVLLEIYILKVLGHNVLYTNHE